MFGFYFSFEVTLILLSDVSISVFNKRMAFSRCGTPCLYKFSQSYAKTLVLYEIIIKHLGFKSQTHEMLYFDQLFTILLNSASQYVFVVILLVFISKFIL